MSTDAPQPPSTTPRRSAPTGATTLAGERPPGSRAGAPGDAGRAGAPAGEAGSRPARTATTSTSRAQPTAAAGPRRVRLAVSRIDPWSVMKLSFLLSVAVGIMIVVAAAAVWYTLDGLHVFSQIDDVLSTLSGSTTFGDSILKYAAFERVVALATIIAVVDVVLLTALSTIGAFLYNIVAALVGGIHLTLTDD